MVFDNFYVRRGREVNNLYRHSKGFKSPELIWTTYEVRIGKGKSSFRVLIGYLPGKRPLNTPKC